MSFPVHCGIYTEIKTPDGTFHIGPGHEILRIIPPPNQWCHPHEWLKRTKGDDWVYYSTGGYTGVFEATGEYYLPNFNYSSNNILGGHPFAQKEIESISAGWYPLLQKLAEKSGHLPEKHRHFLEDLLANNPLKLREKAKRLHEIIGGRISVLPPDARHVDYDVIPLTISRGCLYKCRFCKVKNNIAFHELTLTEINAQLLALKELYAGELINYNSLFLGEHDALHSSPSLIMKSIECAFSTLELQHSFMQKTSIFSFGSVTSLLAAPESLFQELDRLPATTYINIGFESADQQTLNKIGKPLSANSVREGFQRMQEINDRFQHVEITGNFIMDDDLPDHHYEAILQLIRESLTRTKPKGSIYFSPLSFDRPSRKQLFAFHRLKVASRLPTYLYIIQRL